jgi:hypothetical protein
VTREKINRGKKACQGLTVDVAGVGSGDGLNDSVSIESGANPEPKVATAKQNSIVHVKTISLRATAKVSLILTLPSNPSTKCIYHVPEAQKWRGTRYCEIIGMWGKKSISIDAFRYEDEMCIPELAVWLTSHAFKIYCKQEGMPW